MNFLTEAFKALDVLNEDTFKADEQGLEELKDFIGDDKGDDVVSIIDIDAEDEEEVKDSYIGKVILCCNVCKSNIYKDKEDVVVDEDTELANVDEECPYCHTVDGFMVVGMVAPFEEVKAEADDDDVEVKVDGEEVDVKEDESLTEAKKSEDDIDAIRDNRVERAKRRFTRVRDDADSRRDYEKKHDMKECDEMKNESCSRKRKKKVDEDFSEVEVTTAGESKQRIKVSSEEVEGEETIVPVSDEVEDEIMMSSEEETTEEEPVEETEEETTEEEGIVEESLNSLCSKYLKENYSNVKSFRLTNALTDGKKLKLEGVIKFASGNDKKTSFLFEKKETGRNGKVKLLGENLQICRGKKAFVLNARMRGNKLLGESLSYNYMTKNNEGKSQRVSGTVSNKRG